MRDHDDLANWPKCAVPACPNRCCRVLQSKYCWPHTPGDPRSAGWMSEHLLITETLPSAKNQESTHA